MAECPTKSACKDIHLVKQVGVAWWKCDGGTSDILKLERWAVKISEDPWLEITNL